MGWAELKRLLIRRGCSDDVVKVAYLAFVSGVKRGLYIYGDTTFPCKADAELEWNEYYGVACDDFNEAITAFGKAKGGA